MAIELMSSLEPARTRRPRGGVLRDDVDGEADADAGAAANTDGAIYIENARIVDGLNDDAAARTDCRCDVRSAGIDIADAGRRVIVEDEDRGRA